MDEFNLWKQINPGFLPWKRFLEGFSAKKTLFPLCFALERLDKAISSCYYIP